MSIFEIKNCRKKFTNIAVLHDISFKVEEGEVIAILGSSGSGKSTLLRIATFLDTMDDGEMFYLDKKIVSSIDGKAVYANDKKLTLDKLGHNKLIENTKNYFGLVFQNFNLFPHWNVFKNVIDAPLSVQKRDRKEVFEKAEMYLDKMGLLDKKDAYPYELSGGQKQRVAIARALCTEPKIIFFDEPTSALDPELTLEILKVIKELANEKRTMVVVTHEMNFAKEVADRAIFIDKGYVVEEGDAKILLTNPKEERTKKFLQKYNCN